MVTELDAPALMFGGLNVIIGECDVRVLFNVLVQHRDGIESQKLNALASSPSIYEYIQPYTHGYELAYQAREALGIDHYATYVDIEKILSDLVVTIRDETLQTNSVRGVAVAGVGFSPSILVNKSSGFNENKRGRRFTLAHELCHILFDRSSARRLSHISGPWASARVEKRANAFAAMFLATPHALEKASAPGDLRTRIKQLSEEFEIGTRALLEHMRNLDLLNDDELLQMTDRNDSNY